MAEVRGDQVAVDDPLLEVSTDKVDTEIPSPVAGTLTKILVQEDETVRVGADLAVIGDGWMHRLPKRRPSRAPAGEQAPEAPSTEAPSTPRPPPPRPPPSRRRRHRRPRRRSSLKSRAPAAGSRWFRRGRHDRTMPALGESVTEGTVTRWLEDGR